MTDAAKHRLLQTERRSSLTVPGKPTFAVRVNELVNWEISLGVVPERRKQILAVPFSGCRNKNAGTALKQGVARRIERDWISRAEPVYVDTEDGMGSFARKSYKYQFRRAIRLI